MTSERLKVLVLDAATCTHACDEIARALSLGVKLAVTDVVFDRELRARGGERLVRRGLRVERLADIGPAITVHREHPALSLGDAFSLSLSAANAWPLVTSSPLLASLADELGVSVTSLERLIANIVFERSPARVGYPRSTYLLRSAVRR